MPGHGYLGFPLRLDDLLDVGLKRIVRHAELASRIKGLFREKEAVFAVEIADRTSGFGQEMKIRGRITRPDLRQLRHTPAFGRGLPERRRAASILGG